MKYSFKSNNILTRKTKLFISPKALVPLANVLKSSALIENSKDYNALIAKIINEAKKIPLKKEQKTDIFSQEIASIHSTRPLTEKTPWGGVVLKKVDVEKDYIRKLLVVKELGILGFEIHKKKLEKLTVLEGICLVLFRNGAKKTPKEREVAVKLATVGDKFVIEPNDEHGMIALTSCVIQETSTNHLDDLIFLFNSRQVI